MSEVTPPYWTAGRKARAAICVLLHILILLNVYFVDQKTPRVVDVQICPAALGAQHG